MKGLKNSSVCNCINVEYDRKVRTVLAPSILKRIKQLRSVEKVRTHWPSNFTPYHMNSAHAPIPSQGAAVPEGHQTEHSMCPM